MQELKHGEKNKNKEATPEKINALKEAIEKAKSQKVVSSEQGVVREEIKPASAKSSSMAKEVPEDMLRKILKGE